MRTELLRPDGVTPVVTLRVVLLCIAKAALAVDASGLYDIIESFIAAEQIDDGRRRHHDDNELVRRQQQWPRGMCTEALNSRTNPEPIIGLGGPSSRSGATPKWEGEVLPMDRLVQGGPEREPNERSNAYRCPCTRAEIARSSQAGQRSDQQQQAERNEQRIGSTEQATSDATEGSLVE